MVLLYLFFLILSSFLFFFRGIKVDETYFNSLKWMLENDITGVIENTFTDENEVFGVMQTVELKPGGAQIAVTEENKREYVRLIVRHRLLHGIADQVCV